MRCPQCRFENREGIRFCEECGAKLEQTCSACVAAAEARQHGSVQTAIEAMIACALEAMYSRGEDNRFLEVTYANGDKEIRYFKDFVSGAMVESVVRRAKKLALKRYIGGAKKGITTDDLLVAVREEFKENEDLPNTINPDDWAKIAGKKGERIVYVKPLLGETNQGPPRARRRDLPSRPRSDVF